MKRLLPHDEHGRNMMELWLLVRPSTEYGSSIKDYGLGTSHLSYTFDEKIKFLD
ncbi:hypothetical protein HPP92_025990 [Vanilla planifolia]|uniref:Uncharacterized protein n=1 Tax=Vanilla planifolia TaxID=51239 RepID=A0A835U6Y0_VANPL|nr:hypothetical protein HPP92_026275 [Vanilla planifolia]KAG0451899.1 hypothetical protein HPP92_025990 [Vanilla planifolia]